MLYGALVVTLWMLRRLISCRIIIITPPHEYAAVWFITFFWQIHISQLNQMATH